MYPNLIIIGAMKAGTTSLFNYLNSHPKISGSKIKETNFFRADQDFRKGVEWYQNLFDNTLPYSFEASPDYSKKHLYPDVPFRIKSLMPDVKLVYVLRDPIKRIVSHYTHNLAFGTEKRTLINAISNDSSSNNYINTSKYYYQLEEFLNYFDEKQILLIDSDNLNDNPKLVVNSILNFIGINREFDSEIFLKKFHNSSTKKHWTPLERKFNNLITYQPLRSFLKKISSPIRRPLRHPKINEDEISLLKDLLIDDIEKLRSFSGLKFPHWSI